jgi:hypothetical protein
MDYVWSEQLERAAQAFGGRYPDAELEAELLEVFAKRPAFVVDAIDDVANAHKAGRIHSPWPFLRKKVQEPASELVVTDESERDARVKSAERWLRSAGLHFDRESEVEDELYGDRGRLQAWAGDEELRERLLGIWRECAPRGEQAEAEALVRARERVEIRERIAEAKRQARAELQAKAETEAA